MTQGCDGRCAEPLDFDFAIAFQPIVDLDARRIYAYEALARGPDGEPASAVLGAVNEKNRYAFDQACRVKAIETAAARGLDRRLNINFLPRAVYHPEACLRASIKAAQASQFPIDQITFEFTENEKVSDRLHLKGIVETYRRHGFMTALDDFGSGYAGLSLFADFVTDIIKLDRELIREIDTDAARQAIVAGLVTTARELGVTVAAEGVERSEEVEVLRAMGINLYQGFLFARPTLGRLTRDSEIQWD